MTGSASDVENKARGFLTSHAGRVYSRALYHEAQTFMFCVDNAGKHSINMPGYYWSR